MEICDTDRPEKRKPSLNAVLHGCCAKTVLLPDEDEAAFNELRDGWVADYQPTSEPAFALVYEAVKAQWQLLRTQIWYNKNLRELPKDPLQWSEENHKSIEHFSRYRTTAERGSHRAFNDLEGLRKSRNREINFQRRAEERAAAIQLRIQKRDRKGAESPDPSKPEPFFNGQTAPEKQRKIVTLDQWIEVDIDENGNTVTTLFPSNEDLIKDGRKMWPAPELIYRRFHFVKHVPPEYYWATPSPERRARGGAGIQRMSVDTWLETIELEKASGSPHIGPCSKPLPRPKERGECDCPVCTELYAQMEAEATNEHK